MSNFYCEYCGTKFISMAALTGTACYYHPLGCNKGKHKLYEGSEKSQYICKYCGLKFPNLKTLCGTTCTRHPQGVGKGKHSPAL